MKILVSLILFIHFMDFKEFENLIRKDISYANLILLDEGFKHKSLLGVSLYKSDSNKLFYGMTYNMISIMEYEDRIVKDVTIHLHQIINRDFYDLFIMNYGNPDTIQVIDSFDSLGKWTVKEPEEEIELEARKVTLKMKEGTFEETPLFMIWNKEIYQIKILLKHEQNISEITFRVPTDKL